MVKYIDDLETFQKVGHADPHDYSEKTRILGSQLRADVSLARAIRKAEALRKSLKGFVPILDLNDFI